jgi:hypothetical protein
MVSVDVPELFATEVGATAQVGPVAVAPATLQVRATVPLNPATDPTVIIEVADAPGATLAAEIAPAESVKSGTAAAATERFTFVV